MSNFATIASAESGLCRVIKPSMIHAHSLFMMAGYSSEAAFYYNWAFIDNSGRGSIHAGSLIFNYSGQTPCCLNTSSGEVIGTCAVSDGHHFQPSFSWGGSRMDKSAGVRILCLTPIAPPGSSGPPLIKNRGLRNPHKYSCHSNS